MEQRRYWAMRVHKAPEPLEYLIKELREGRLRQGWGNADELDLREIRDVDPAIRSKEQRDTWKHRRYLSSRDGMEDGINSGDIILIPNVPEPRRWAIVRVLDDIYEYDFDNQFDDYGHIRHVEWLNLDNPINPKNEAVHSRLRGTMRNPGRLWSVDSYGEYIEILLREIEITESLSQAADESKSLEIILSKMREALWEELDRNFRGAEFEKPCKKLFEAIYDNVEHTGGPSERGADFICTSVDPLGVSHTVAIQVKKWDDSSDLRHPLEQIVDARQNYENVNAAVIFTTLETVTADAEETVKETEVDLGIPIALVTRDEVLNLFLKYLPDFQVEVLE